MRYVRALVLMRSIHAWALEFDKVVLDLFLAPGRSFFTCVRAMSPSLGLGQCFREMLSEHRHFHINLIYNPIILSVINDMVLAIPSTTYPRDDPRGCPSFELPSGFN